MSFSLAAYSRAREVFDPETGVILVFLTNNLNLGATTIAAIYKGPLADGDLSCLWFKALKQNLKIKPSWEPALMPLRLKFGQH